VGSPLVRRISPIPNRKVGGHIERSQAATHALLGRLIETRGITGNAIARTGQICAGNSEERRFARAGAKGKNVVENAVIPNIDLVNHVGGENVSFRERQIATVVFDMLVAAKGILF